MTQTEAESEDVTERKLSTVRKVCCNEQLTRASARDCSTKSSAQMSSLFSPFNKKNCRSTYEIRGHIDMSSIRGHSNDKTLALLRNENEP